MVYEILIYARAAGSIYKDTEVEAREWLRGNRMRAGTLARKDFMSCAAAQIADMDSGILMGELFEIDADAHANSQDQSDKFLGSGLTIDDQPEE